ncbi:hypothetical protein PR048_011135 [Dryococelus australis]|uniref:Integrase catalytic domain-containing protein n=1 Tax=Dryococelus australis TaxID=614101 RepID=A0ABQ9HKS5_9NEOP|nr:hypothetical protein PR048_011135 [Dryococelus australis]
MHATVSRKQQIKESHRNIGGLNDMNMKTRVTLFELAETTYPFQRILMDIVGLLLKTLCGRKNLLTIIANFSIYLVTYTIKDEIAETVAIVFVFEWILKNSAADAIISDQGTSFMTEVMLLKITKLRSTPGHLEENRRKD